VSAAVAIPMDELTPRGDTPELIALLTPTGRDAAVATRVLANAGLGAFPPAGKSWRRDLSAFALARSPASRPAA